MVLDFQILEIGGSGPVTGMASFKVAKTAYSFCYFEACHAFLSLPGLPSLAWPGWPGAAALARPGLSWAFHTVWMCFVGSFIAFPHSTQIG